MLSHEATLPSATACDKQACKSTVNFTSLKATTRAYKLNTQDLIINYKYSTGIIPSAMAAVALSACPGLPW